MKNIQLLPLIVLSVFLFNACSVSTQAPTEPNPSITPSLELTSTPPATATTAPTETPTTAPTEAPATATPEAATFDVNSSPENFRHGGALVELDPSNSESVANYNKVMVQYFNWLKNLPIIFDEKQVKPLVLKEFDYGDGPFIFPDLYDGSINFSIKDQIPWNFPTYNLIFIKGPDGVDYPGMLEPIIFHKDGKNYPVVTVRNIYEPNFPPPRYSANKDLDIMSTTLASRIKGDVARIMFEGMRYGFTGESADDPVAVRTFQNFPDMPDRITKFLAGDLNALSQGGIVLLTRETSPDETIYQP